MTTSTFNSNPDSDEAVTQEVITLAEGLLNVALRRQTGTEKKDAAKLGRMMDDPAGKAFTFAMVDEVFRSRDAAVSAKRWRGLLDGFGVPRFLSQADRLSCVSDRRVAVSSPAW